MLTLTGDAEDNQVVISGTDTAGEVVISGGGGTEVNGDMEAVTFTDVTDVVLDLGRGADTALVTGLDLAGGLSGDLGRGADRLVISANDAAAGQIRLNDGSRPEIGSVTIGGNVDVAASSGEDVIRVVGSSDEADAAGAVAIAGDLMLDGGANVDEVVVRHASAANVSISTGWGDDHVMLRDVETEGDLSVRTGQGDDALDLRNIAAGTLEIATAGGDDEVAARLNNVTATTAEIRTGRGEDNVEIRDSLFGELTLRLGKGNDRATLLNVEAEDALTVFGGDGNDRLALDGVAAAQALLNTGAGNDSIWLTDSEFDDLRINFGDGNDRLSAEGTVANAFTLVASKGKDKVQDRGDNAIAGLEDLLGKHGRGKDKDPGKGHNSDHHH
jgi:hypothetical protein